MIIMIIETIIARAKNIEVSNAMQSKIQNRNVAVISYLIQ
jgi:hypothetical protein